MLDLYQNVLKAESLIRPFIRETLLEYSVPLSKKTNTNLFLKCENLQYTNSFKLRGAFNKLLHLNPQEKAKGIVTASSGNHGAAVAYALDKLDIPGLIFVPENTSLTKVDNINNYKIPLRFYGTDCLHAENEAKRYATEKGMIYVSPYNDKDIIAGQGTIGFELHQQLAHIDAVFVAVGGGGLITGIASYLKKVSPLTKIIGCLPANSPVMAESIKANKIIDMASKPTLSDATAGGIESNPITFQLCKKLVDDYVLLNEEEIKEAILLAIKANHLLIEGASAVALAAALKYSAQFSNKNVVVILSGGNIALDTLKKIFS